MGCGSAEGSGRAAGSGAVAENGGEGQDSAVVEGRNVEHEEVVAGRDAGHEVAELDAGQEEIVGPVAVCNNPEEEAQVVRQVRLAAGRIRNREKWWFQGVLMAAVVGRDLEYHLVVQ
jgi:hypothetical protein